MDENKWFKRLWRVNAVLILLVLVVGTGAYVYRTVRGWFYEPYYGTSNIRQLVLDATGDTVLKAEWRYGDPEEVPGTSRFIVPLNRVFRGDRDELLGFLGPTLANLLFVDADLGAKRWFLPDNEKLGWTYELLTRGEGKDKTTLAIRLGFSEESDEIDEETGKKVWKKSIYLARPDGTGHVRVIECVDRIIDEAVADESHLVVFYVKDNMGHAARIDLSDFSIVGSTKLQPIE